MAFVLFLSLFLLLVGLALLLRGLATRRDKSGGPNRRISPWLVPVLGVLIGLTLLFSGPKAWSVIGLPFLLRLLQLFSRLPLASIFWALAYLLQRFVRLSAPAPPRLVRGRAPVFGGGRAAIVSPKQARRILGLKAGASPEEIRARTTDLLRAAKDPARRGAGGGEAAGEKETNIICLKILEAREVLLHEAAQRDGGSGL